MSNVRLGSMQWQLGLDQGNFQQGLAAAEGQVRQFGEKTTGSFSAMGVAMGNLISQGITKLAGAFQGLAGSAIQATANYQQMEVGLESLLAREIARGTEATRTTQVMVAGKEAELDKIAALQIAYDDYAIKLDKAKYHLAEISKTQGPGDIDFRAYANDVADYNLKLEQTKAKMDALRGTSDHMVTVTEKYMVGQMKISDAMPEAQKRAKGLMDELAKIAILSPYQVENVQQTYKMAMAFGYTSEQAKDFTQAILNVAAGTGATNDMLDRMAYNFAQIRMQGKVTAMDIRQLAMAGFDLTSVLKSVGDQFGVNIENHEDFNAAIANGSITWEQFTQGFKKYADDNFGGASERMAKTLNGLKSTFKDVFVLTFPKLLGPAAEHVTGFLQKMLDGFLKIRESGVLDELGQKIGDFVGGVVGNLEALMALPKVIQDLASADPRNLAELKDILSQLPAGLRGVAEAGAELVTAFRSGGLKEAFEVVKDWAGEAWGKISDWWNTDGAQWAEDTAKKIKDRLDAIPGKINELGLATADWLTGAWNAIHGWWDTGGAQWAATTAGKIGDALASIPDQLLSMGMAAGDWLAGVWTSMQTWWDTGGEEWARGIADKISEWFGKIGAILKSDKVPQWVNDAMLWLEDAWLGIANWWITFAEPLTTSLVANINTWMNTSFIPALKATDKTTWTAGIGESLMMAVNGLGDWLNANKDVFAVMVGDLLGKLIAFGVESMLKVSVGLPLMFWGAIVNLLTGDETEKAKAGNSVATWFIDGLVNGFNNFMAQSDFIGWLKGKGIFIVDSIVNGISTGIEHTIDGIKAKWIWFVDGFVNAIKGALGISSPSTVFWQIAQDLVAGLRNGIEDAARGFKDWIVGWARDLIPEPLWKFFGIASPSKLMIDMGRNIGGGLATGILQSSGDVAAAMGVIMAQIGGTRAPALAFAPAMVSGASGGSNGAGNRVSSGSGGHDLPPITINVYATGGNADTVRGAAIDGVNEALRARGYR